MSVRLEPMTPAEYDVWHDAALNDYAQQIADSGSSQQLEEAQKRANEDFARLLPDGLETKDHHIWTAFSSDEPVGTIWIHVMPDRTPVHAFVYSLDVDQAHQRRGHGQAIMEAVIEICRARGVGTMGLNVFGHNEVARRLYDRLGFQVASTSMKRTL
jgi:ribosomal protein S18 acetylase RimI-like enzyme